MDCDSRKGGFALKTKIVNLVIFNYSYFVNIYFQTFDKYLIHDIFNYILMK